jgi:uncharacterized protein (DUF362 family)
VHFAIGESADGGMPARNRAVSSGLVLAANETFAVDVSATMQAPMMEARNRILAMR